MAYFQAVGTIATDIIRQETRQGVLARFRLASGSPGQGQLWIDVQTWGHTAGILNTHGQTGRGIALAGRLQLNTWRDRATGAARTKLIVNAYDLDFINPDLNPGALAVTNQVTAVGRLTSHPQSDPSDQRITFTITSGQARTKTGRLDLPVAAWGRTTQTARTLTKSDHIAVAGRLTYRRQPDTKTGYYELSAYTLSPITPKPANALVN